MRFGKYDQKIQFVSFGKVSNGSGGYIPTEKTDLVTFARIDQLRVRADVEQAQKQLPATYRVGVIARNGFNPTVKNVIKWRGEAYQIISTPQVESVRLHKEWIFDIIRSNNG
jgi:hypothetical protein